MDVLHCQWDQCLPHSQSTSDNHGTSPSGIPDQSGATNDCTLETHVRHGKPHSLHWWKSAAYISNILWFIGADMHYWLIRPDIGKKRESVCNVGATCWQPPKLLCGLRKLRGLHAHCSCKVTKTRVVSWVIEQTTEIMLWRKDLYAKMYCKHYRNYCKYCKRWNFLIHHSKENTGLYKLRLIWFASCNIPVKYKPPNNCICAEY